MKKLLFFLLLLSTVSFGGCESAKTSSQKKFEEYVSQEIKIETSIIILTNKALKDKLISNKTAVAILDKCKATDAILAEALVVYKTDIARAQDKLNFAIASMIELSTYLKNQGVK